MGLVDILLAILLISASVLCFYLIKLIKRLFITLDIIDTEIKELDSKLTPLISNLQEIANSGNTVANFAKEQTENINSFIESIKNKFGGSFQKKSEKTSPKTNAFSLVTNLRAIVKAATSFFSELK
jgi:uncharacterized protein YoxC